MRMTRHWFRVTCHWGWHVTDSRWHITDSGWLIIQGDTSLIQGDMPKEQQQSWKEGKSWQLQQGSASARQRWTVGPLALHGFCNNATPHWQVSELHHITMIDCGKTIRYDGTGERDSSVVRALDSWSKGHRLKSGGRIFSSRVNFLCRLLFQYPFHPCYPVTNYVRVNTHKGVN